MIFGAIFKEELLRFRERLNEKTHFKKWVNFYSNELNGEVNIGTIWIIGDMNVHIKHMGFNLQIAKICAEF